MNRINIVIAFALVTEVVYAQEINFQVDFSENYAVFEFANHLSDRYPTNAFKRIFENSKYDTEEYRTLINDFSKINYFYWYEYPQYPFGSKIGGSTYFLLAKYLIESKTLEEFKTKSFGIIPNSDLEQFYETLSKLLPVYRELVYGPSIAKFEVQLKDVRMLINSIDISRYFNQAIRFHDSSWNNSITFYMSLYPIPDQRSKGFTATAFYNQAVGGIPLGLKDYELLLSVMFHEAFHILHDEQSLQVKREIDMWFDDNESRSSKYAQLLFNESITTALANGYVYKEIRGALLDENWYNNKYIAQMAKSLYPLVNEYLEGDMKMDQEFINSYIKIFDEEYNGWMNELHHLSMNRFIITEDSEDLRAIRKKFRYNNIEDSLDKITRLTLEKMKELPITKVIVVSKGHNEKLQLIKNTFEELSEWELDHDKNFSQAVFLKDGTYLIIINRHQEEIESLLQNVEFLN